MIAKAATPAAAYTIRWSRFDNDSGRHEPAGDSVTVAQPGAAAPVALLRSAAYVAVTVQSEHPDHAAWRQPVQAYFRRAGNAWNTVGLFRETGADAGELGKSHRSGTRERPR